MSELPPRASGRLERTGSGVSPGIGIGPAYVVDRRRVDVLHSHVAREEVEAEQQRFQAALKGTQEQLEAIKAKLPHGEHRQILKAQQMMLRDPHLIQRTEALISDELINAEWAVVRAVDEIRDALGRASDEYFRERQFDVAFMGERILQNLQGDHPGEINPPEGAVVIAYALSPADTAQLHRCQVAAIVSEEGGQTSHSAIMARALEIPAVVGVDHLIDQVETGDLVVVDGVQGSVLARPGEDELESLREQAKRYHDFEVEIHKERALPAMTRDGVHVSLRANLALSQETESARAHGAEGVGLYRTEYMFMGRDTCPSEEEHYRAAKAVLQACAPYPVCVRTFDLGSDKTARLFHRDDVEANPAMGVRSLRLALLNRDAFLAQLRGLLRAAVHGPLRIMLPLVSGTQELWDGLEAVSEAREQLYASGMPYADDVPLGIMIEVPSAALVSDILAKQVDFMSIGTNDLIQYTLAIDRENDDVNYLYEPLHPAILRLLKRVCEAADDAEIPVSLCGEMAADPRFTWLLFGLGLRELSMHPAAIPVVKNIIRASSAPEMTALADAVLSSGSVADARLLIREQMEGRFPEHMQHGAVGAKAERNV